MMTTYCIVGRDETSGDVGCAIASAWTSVGSVVPYVRPGVGVVASQCYANAALAESVLDKLQTGMSADEAIDHSNLLQLDPQHRQLLVITHDGRTAGFTGEQNPAPANHIVYPGKCVAAGNTLADPTIPAAMAKQFMAKQFTAKQFTAKTQRPLAERLLSALQKGQELGGDARGKIAAALRVWNKDYPNTSTCPIDLRVDSDADPVAKLDALYQEFMSIARPMPRNIPLITEKPKAQKTFTPLEQAQQAKKA